MVNGKSFGKGGGGGFTYLLTLVERVDAVVLGSLMELTKGRQRFVPGVLCVWEKGGGGWWDFVFAECAQTRGDECAALWDGRLAGRVEEASKQLCRQAGLWML